MSRRKQVNPQHLSLTHRETIPGEFNSSQTLHGTRDWVALLLILIFKMKTLSFETCVITSVREWCNEEAFSPTKKKKKLLCGNTFNNVVTLVHPRVKHSCDFNVISLCLSQGWRFSVQESNKIIIIFFFKNLNTL